MSREPVALFSLRSGAVLASAVARHLGVPVMPHEEREFEDGEFKIRALADVRGERAVVFQSCAGSAGASANDKLMRALIFAGSLKDAGAAGVTFVAPYLAYARKDRRTKARDPVSTLYVAQMIEAVGIDEIVVADVHKFPGHIACDSASNSEIVVPLIAGERVIGVLDIGSPELSRFDDQDAAELQALAANLLAASDWQSAISIG